MRRNPRLAAALAVARPRRSKRHVIPQRPDLFGGQPVTPDDLIRWCCAVARLPHDSPRLAWYIRAYNVADKVARSKAAGTFWQIVSACRCHNPPFATTGEPLP